MGKIIIDPVNSEEIQEWKFPQIDISRHEEDLIESVKENENEFDNQDEDDHAMIERQKQEVLELERQKEELKNKIAIIDKISDQLKDPLHFVNEDLIDLIQIVIKKAVKNIISKEIKSDSSLINKMIDGLKELIQEKNGMINVFMSEIDFKRFNHDETDNMIFVKSDGSLSEGDLIVKSNHAEIRAILTERLDKMIGVRK